MGSIWNPAFTSKQPNVLPVQVCPTPEKFRMRSWKHTRSFLLFLWGTNPTRLWNEDTGTIVPALAAFLPLPVLLLPGEKLINTERVYLIKLFFLYSSILIMAGFSSLLTKGLSAFLYLNILNIIWIHTFWSTVFFPMTSCLSCHRSGEAV